MAKEDEKPTSADKGKGKAVEETKDPKNEKDAKGKKEDEKTDLPAGMYGSLASASPQ